MYFKSDRERLAHPQASLLPSYILAEWMGNELSDLHIGLMSRPLVEITADLKTLKTDPPAAKIIYWLCIEKGHKEISDEELRQVARDLGLEENELYSAALHSGRISLLVPSWGRLISSEMRYKIFLTACKSGVFDLINELIKCNPAEILSMIRANNYEGFHHAALYGHNHVFKELLRHLRPDEKFKMIEANNYGVLYNAVQCGDLAIINKIAAIASDRMKEILAAQGYRILKVAIEKGDLLVTERLLTFLDGKVTEAIGSMGYMPLSLAAKRGHFYLLQMLMKTLFITLEAKLDEDIRLGRITPSAKEARLETELLTMLQANNYGVYHSAAQNGHLKMFHHLVKLLPSEQRSSELLKMIRSENYYVFCMAASGNSVEFLELLVSLVPEDEIEKMLAANDCEALYAPLNQQSSKIIAWLLRFPSTLVNLDTNEKLARILLDELKKASDAGWDIKSPEELKCYFYILRNLIRQNKVEVLPDILFLLEAPALKASLQEAFTAEGPNELLRLARRVGNQGAAEILLTITDVRELAVENNYYADEPDGAINLAAIVLNDHESALRDLSQEEKLGLEAAIVRYMPTVQGDRDELFMKLLQTLGALYIRDPAFIRVGNEVKKLPLDWGSFAELCTSLTPAEQEAALKAYYSHKTHTAFRYLSIPNDWMHPEADYVEADPDDPSRRWAVIDDTHLDLILLYWQGAIDSDIPDEDGYTPETRMEFFIHTLAEMGRAHNWDNSEVTYDDEGSAFMREFDDMTADKPTCLVGMRKRLVHSVPGHRLLKVVTFEHIKQELSDFVCKHFASCVNDINRAALWDAWKSYIENLTPPMALQQLNIPVEVQAAFIGYLTEKYGKKFTEVKRFKEFVEKELQLVDGASDPLKTLHVLKLSGLAKPEYIQRLLCPITPGAAETSAAPATLTVAEDRGTAVIPATVAPLSIIIPSSEEDDIIRNAVGLSEESAVALPPTPRVVVFSPRNNFFSKAPLSPAVGAGEGVSTDFGPPPPA